MNVILEGTVRAIVGAGAGAALRTEFAAGVDLAAGAVVVQGAVVVR